MKVYFVLEDGYDWYSVGIFDSLKLARESLQDKIHHYGITHVKSWFTIREYHINTNDYIEHSITE